MSKHVRSPSPRTGDTERIRAMFLRRKRPPIVGTKHLPPISGEHLYFDTRLKYSGYWMIGDTACHFSHAQRVNFGPFVRYRGRKIGMRSEYMAMDAPNPCIVKRPLLVNPGERSISPEFVYEGPRRTGYPSDEDECT